MNSPIIKKIAGAVIVVLVLIQFFTIDQTNVQIDHSKDFISLTKPNKEIATLLKSACYDCHSNQTEYPWYSNVAPISWWLKNHIEEASGHLNFSNWGTYTLEQKVHKLEEVVEEVEEGEMPLNSYTWAHEKARLSPIQKEQFLTWIKALKP